MTGTVYKGASNIIYTLAERIGGGGEGEVYAVKEDNTLVVKFYKEPLDRNKIDKLNFMVSMASDELLRFAAWPLDVVRGLDGRPCGFTMKRLDGYVPLHMLFTPGNRKNIFPAKGYDFLVHVARNLAVAFHKVHQLGVIVGDVNEANILVKDSGMVALIDCDSFQIKNGTHNYYCEVGMLRYTPPELLQLGGFDQTLRTVNTDAFSLATLIFQLLFLGRPPFTGINPGNQEIDEEMAIMGHDFAYSLRNSNKRLLPAKNSLSFEALSPGLINAFHSAFESKVNRPTPLSWANELTVQLKALAVCAKSKLHAYPAKLNSCPWCKFMQEDNIHYFLDDSYRRAMPELNNIEQFVNGFKLDPLRIKVLPSTHQSGQMPAQEIDQHFHVLKMINWIVYLAIFILTIVLCFQSLAYAPGGIVVFLLFKNLSPTRKKLKEELMLREDLYKQFTQDFQKIVKQHNGLPDYNLYKEAAKKLTASIDAFRGLPVEYTREKKNIENKHYQGKYVQFLNQFEVLYCQIDGFGPSKKRSIYAAGIKTAADVGKLGQMKIPGIGPKNEQLLFDWQRHVGAGFTYRPDTLVITAEISQLTNVIVKKRQELERNIRQQYQTVVGMRSTIMISAQTLEKKYNELLPRMQQAELDYHAFHKLVK